MKLPQNTEWRKRRRANLPCDYDMHLLRELSNSIQLCPHSVQYREEMLCKVCTPSAPKAGR